MEEAEILKREFGIYLLFIHFIWSKCSSTMDTDMEELKWERYWMEDAWMNWPAFFILGLVGLGCKHWDLMTFLCPSGFFSPETGCSSFTGLQENPKQSKQTLPFIYHVSDPNPPIWGPDWLKGQQTNGESEEWIKGLMRKRLSCCFMAQSFPGACHCLATFKHGFNRFFRRVLRLTSQLRNVNGELQDKVWVNLKKPLPIGQLLVWLLLNTGSCVHTHISGEPVVNICAAHLWIDLSNLGTSLCSSCCPPTCTRGKAIWEITFLW